MKAWGYVALVPVAALAIGGFVVLTNNIARKQAERSWAEFFKKG